MLKKILVTAFLSVVFFDFSSAQNHIEAQIDQNVKAVMTDQQIPGVSVAIIKNGTPLYVKGYGFANVEHQVPVKPETVFQSGSIGKQFTATAVMILVEEGKLALDDKIRKYFPDAPDAWKEITIRHLLSHTSGMGDYPEQFDYRRDYTEDDFMKMIMATPLKSQPGEKWEYSNLAYVTLGVLIGKLTGKHYGEFLRERVFQPLGMTTARVISEEDIIPNRASGYSLRGGALKNQRWVSPSINSTADGALYLTAVDMTKWEAGLSSEKILKQSSYEQMWAPTRLNSGQTVGYGFGWEISGKDKRRVISHGGAWQGFKSFIARYPDDNLTIAVFANLAQTNPIMLTRAVASVFYPEFAIKHKILNDGETATTDVIRRVLIQLSENKTDLNSFTKQAQQDFFHTRSKQVEKKLNIFTFPLAVIYDLKLIDRQEKNGLKTSKYLISDLTNSLVVSVETTKDEKIADIKVIEDR